MKHRVFLVALPLVVAVLFLPSVAGRDSFVYAAVLTPRVLSVIASLFKLAALAVGAIFAARCVRRFDKGDSVRPAWACVCLWLAFFFVGQLVLSTYEDVLRVDPPVPSFGDTFFLLGYLFVLVALVRFVFAYRASGYPLGRTGGHLAIAGGATGLFTAAAVQTLWPIAVGPTSLSARIINVGYPLLDFALLVPALVLVRLTVPLRGGRVWAAWATLLAGIVSMTAGDFVMADMTPIHLETFGQLGQVLAIVGYTFSAYGVMLQDELLSS